MLDRTQVPDDAPFECLRYVILNMLRGKNPDLTLRQLDMLLAIKYRVESPTVKDLALFLKIPRTAVSQCVKRLAHVGLVERRPSIDDGRQLTLHLLPSAVEYLEEIEGIVQYHF